MCVHTNPIYIHTVCVCVCVCVCMREGFKELPDAVIEAGKSKIRGAGWQAGAPGKS